MNAADGDIGARVEALDISLFDAIPTLSLDGDRRAWLAVQRAFRRQNEYVYLEIGSHLGGSIQQHLADARCPQIVSIDKRPPSQPDDRGGGERVFEENSTARMLDHLRRVAPDSLGKIAHFDADAKDINPQALPAVPDFCFIDGEHTHAAVLSDFAFCLRVCAPNAAICFHDDWVVYPALRQIVGELRQQGIPFTARKLTGVTFGIFLRDCPAIRDPYVSTQSQSAESWFRFQQLRSYVPDRIQRLAHRITSWYRRSRDPAKSRATAG